MSRRATLRVPNEGPCAGHPCDACERCAGGDCCGADVGEAGLPLEGSWPDDFFGSLGVLIEQNGKLRCHCCGEWHRDLSKHVRAHNLSADAYRSLWGLNSTTGLLSTELKAIKSELGRAYGHRLSASDVGRPTSEQRSRWARAREARAETKLRRGEQPRDHVGVWVEPSPGTITARLSRRNRHADR